MSHRVGWSVDTFPDLEAVFYGPWEWGFPVPQSSLAVGPLLPETLQKWV